MVSDKYSFARKLYSEGASVKSIAAITHSHYSTIYYHVRDIRPYQLNWDIKREDRPANKLFKSFLRRELKKRKQNPSQLAKKLGVSRQLCYEYANGRNLPNKERIKDIFKLLVPEKNYKTLEDLLKDEIENNS